MDVGLDSDIRLYLRPLAYSNYFNNSGKNETKFLGWNLPVESLHMVHPYWRGFLAPPTYHHALYFIIYLALFSFSIFGNGLVIWIFGTSKSLRTPSNLFIINLAVFDLCMAENSLVFLGNSIWGRMLGDDLGCNIYAFMGGIAGVGAAISNAMIAFDRYKTISSPIDGRLNAFQVSMLIVVTWFWAIPFNLMAFLRIWGRYMPEGYLTTCSFDYLTEDDETKNFGLGIFIWAYLIPMIIICTFYTKLFLHVRAHEKMLAEQAKKMNVKSLSANPTANSVEIRIAKAAFTIYFLFICAWTPYTMVFMISNFGNRNLITPFTSMLPAMAAKIVSCIDPWVYAVSHPKYRLQLEKRVPWLGITEKNIPQETESKSTTSDVETAA
ncbi:opsin Rh5 [Eupeodes corollae]|uniref:opsin Rh5 n=1 Tax=Eupeodes corollae TaxID=290404 RepID=UPI002493104B|nr:opsin Rh5 [Eupeodes corollae]